MTSSDPYPFITNCPMDVAPYIIGGPGNITRDVEERRAAVGDQLQPGRHKRRRLFEINPV